MNNQDNFFVALLVLVQFRSLVSGEDTGYFWHVADFHWDPTYDFTNVSSGGSCGPATPTGEDGRYGSYECDAPWLLINSSIYAMKEIKNDADFIIWTGDDTPHNVHLSQDQVSWIINNITAKILEVFPDKQVFPVLGNHDWSPGNQLTPHAHPLYTSIGNMWKKWLSGPAFDQFVKCGFYNASINNNLMLVGLNTNLYYKVNNSTLGLEDPCSQFEWLDKILTYANESNKKVILISHVPPGKFEKHPDYDWFRPSYNDIFIKTLVKHHSILTSMHFGHHHTDSFRIVRDQEDKAVASFLLAPAVTPWRSTLPGILGESAGNPAIRLVKYNKTGYVSDVLQYYLNLTKANENKDINKSPTERFSSALWKEAYIGSDLYGIPSLTTDHLDSVSLKMLNDDELFQKYYEINSILLAKGHKFNQQERMNHFCAIRNLDYDKYNQCMNSASRFFSYLWIYIIIYCLV